MTQGVFLTFEGIDGSGKSEQCLRLAEKLRRLGKQVLVTQEPGGGTRLANGIRSLLLYSAAEREPLSEGLLFFAARYEHWKKIIEPALKEGKFVLSDRFVDSTLAYQVCAGNMSESAYTQLCRMTLGDKRPHITIILDVAPQIGSRRKRLHVDEHKASRSSPPGDCVGDVADETQAAYETRPPHGSRCESPAKERQEDEIAHKPSAARAEDWEADTRICARSPDGTISAGNFHDERESFYDKKSLQFFRKVREGYLRLAQEDSHRCVVVDGAQSPDEVEEDIAKVLRERLQLRLSRNATDNV